MKKIRRFSDETRRALGYRVLSPNEEYWNVDESESTQINDLVKGKFKDIIDMLYSSSDGSLDNNVEQYVSENAPLEVRSFVQNVLLQQIQPLPSAPDDETALATLLPRNVIGSAPLMSRYLENVKSFINSKSNSD